MQQGLRGADKQDGNWVSDTGCGLDLRQKPPNGSVPKEKVCGWMDGWIHGRMGGWMDGRMGGWIVGGGVDQGQQGGSAVTEVKQMDKWGKGVHMHEGPYCCIIQNKK